MPILCYTRSCVAVRRDVAIIGSLRKERGIVYLVGRNFESRSYLTVILGRVSVAVHA